MVVRSLIDGLWFDGEWLGNAGCPGGLRMVCWHLWCGHWLFVYLAMEFRPAVDTPLE